jgi:hypothetical protein
MAIMTAASWAGPLSGKIDDAVLVQSRYGTIVRSMPEKGAPRSPLQTQSEARMAAASRAFGELTREEGQAWAAFGQTLAEAHPKTGRIVGLSAQQAFNRLANKLLQIDAQAVLPRVPPTEPFFGDGVRVTVDAPPPSPSPSPVESSNGSNTIPRGDEEGILFSADAANREGVLTELLLQPLASQHRRTYLQRYRTKAFVHFAGTELQATIPCDAGWYAAAIRFVEAATGRSTAEIELGVLKVG